VSSEAAKTKKKAKKAAEITPAAGMMGDQMAPAVAAGALNFTPSEA
jgi:hypothetical protein